MFRVGATAEGTGVVRGIIPVASMVATGGAMPRVVGSDVRSSMSGIRRRPGSGGGGRRRVLPIALAFLSVLASVGVLALRAPAPALADTGSISGTITGGEFYWVSVAVYNTYNGATPVYSAFPNNITGEYTVTGIAPGTYKVGFSISDESLGAQYYDGKGTFRSADLVTVKSGQDTALGSTVMHPGGTISGYVYDSSSLDPLGGVSVYVYNSAGEYAGETSTSATDGSYAISGLGDTTYQVRFVDSGYDEQWYNGKDETTADWVSVSMGTNTQDIDADLVATGGSLPVIDTVTSSSHPHPSKWYSNSNPSFSWTTNAFSQTIMGYSCTLDQSPTTLPADSVTTTTASYSYTDVADGVWYFHVRAETSAGWGAAALLKIQIDTKAPSAAAKTLSVKAPTAKKGKTLKIRVTISDPPPSCGSATLALALTTRKGAKLWSLAKTAEPTNKALVISHKLKKTLKKGSYFIVCRATDAAGNLQGKATKAQLKIT
jgi:Carboxypeptidase regulatory-like domain